MSTENQIPENILAALEPKKDCFPEMSADDREFLITGICPTCWDLTFGGED